MPDQNVDVTFDRNATPQFTFSSEVVRMTAAGKITLHRRPANAPWVFAGGKIEDPLQQFSFVVRANGKQLQLNDEFKNKREDGAKAYCFKILVEDTTGLQESPDPVIVNDPGARVDTEAETPAQTSEQSQAQASEQSTADGSDTTSSPPTT